MVKVVSEIFWSHGFKKRIFLSWTELVSISFQEWRSWRHSSTFSVTGREVQAMDCSETVSREFQIVVLDHKLILLEKTSFRFWKSMVSIPKSYSSYPSTCNNQFYVILKTGQVLNLHFLKQNPCLDRVDLTLLWIL